LKFRHGGASILGRVLAAGWMTHAGMSGWRDLGHHAAALVVRGRGSYADASGTRRRGDPGSLVLSFPGLRQCYRPVSGTEWTEFYLVFEGPVFELWEERGFLRREQPVVAGLTPVEVWARRFEEVLGAAGSLGASPPMVEVCRLQAVLAEALCHRGGRETQQDEAWLARVRALLESDRHRESAMAEVAAELGMPEHRFRRRFRALAGMSPARFRALRTIDRACELMQMTDLLDREIAERLGFCDEFYFSRRFREITGRSPSEFRAILPTGSKRH
jgi:AraC-like DNA-binding protein